MRVASFVVSLIALCTCWIPCVGWMAAIPAGIGLLLGIIGCIAAKKGEGKGLGIAGIILGAIALLVGIANFHATDEAMSELGKADADFKKALDDVDADFKKAMDAADADFKKAMDAADAEVKKALESAASEL